MGEPRHGPGAQVVIASLMRESGGTGVQSHVATFRDQMAAAGRPALLVTPFSSGSPWLRPVFGARFLVRPLSRSGAVWWYRQWHAHFLADPLRAALRAHPDAVVYAQCPVSAAVALRVRRPGQPVVMAAHFNISQADEWADKGELARDGRHFASIRAFEEEVVPRLDGIVHVSDFSRRVLEERIPGATTVPSVVVPNPVVVSPAPPVDGPAPERTGEQPRRDVVTVGALEPRKNQHYLLDVLAELASRGERPTLTVVGDGPDLPGLRRRAAELGLGDQVRFVGYVPDVTGILAEHRAYAHAARMESFGIAVAEAMAAGLPVVAARVGGLAELVEPGRTGEFWPLDDPAHAADVLHAVLARPRGWGHAGWAVARERFAAPVVCGRIESFLLDRRPAIAGRRGVNRSDQGDQSCV